MNILYVDHYAGSLQHGMEYRPYYFARDWIRAGHKVTIIAASFSHVRQENLELDCACQSEEVDGVPYLWIRTRAYRGNSMDRIWNIVQFCRYLYVHATQLAREYQPDVVIASSTYPLDIYPCRRIAKKAGAKLVHEVHDLWPLSPIELGNFSPRHPYIRLIQAAENYSYKHSDWVISLLPGAFEYMKDHHLTADRFAYIPNGVALEDWESANIESIPEEYKVFFNGLKAKNHFVVGYAGGHNTANMLELLLDAAELLRDKPIAFVLVGKGDKKSELVGIKEQKNLPNVYFLDAVPKRAIASLLNCFDLAFIAWHDIRLYRYGVSANKVFDYMMARRPILQVCNFPHDPVKEAGAGISGAFYTPVELADALEKMLAMSPEQRQALGEAGKRYVLENHNYASLSKRFLDLLKA